MRAAIYLRFSSEMQQDGYSIAAQQRACEGYCQARSWDVVARYSDEAKSARSDNASKRPGFRQMIEDSNAKQFDVIVVHKLDRFARNRRVAFETFENLTKRSVGFVSVSEDMDYSSPAGQLMLTMLVGLSQFYSDNLSFETKKGKAERKRQGRYNGRLPIGYRKAQTGDAEVDPPFAEIVQHIFDLGAQGETHRAIAVRMNALGHRTKGVSEPGLFTKDAIRVILKNRFYLGELPDGANQTTPGRHPAIIDELTFKRADEACSANLMVGRGRRRQHGQSTVRPKWSLSGIACCGVCGARMTRTGTRDDRGAIRCTGRAQGSDCPNSTVYESRIVELIANVFTPFSSGPVFGYMLKEVKQRQQQGPKVDERGMLSRKLDRLKEMYLEGDIAKAEYQTRRSDIEKALAVLPSAVTSDQVVLRDTVETIADLGRQWAIGESDAQNRVALALFEKVEIDARNKKLAVVVTPRPAFEALFRAIRPLMPSSSGSDGIQLLNRTPEDRPQYRKKLSRDEEILVLSYQDETLRELAMRFGVSHETIRRIRKESQTEVIAAD